MDIDENLPPVGEEELTQEEREYVEFKKNAPFLYDLCISHKLELPSLTCQASDPGLYFNLFASYCRLVHSVFTELVCFAPLRDSRLRSGTLPSRLREDAGSLLKKV